ncbi:MAG TPA: hypothetical protein PKE04_10120, partial [Clostridia bacterium]|nr:hypothetical protein [Clostridia bacterium]
GNGVDEAESFGDYLASRKAYLTAVAARKWGKARHVGVWALYDPKSSATLHVQAETGHPGALRPEEDSFAGLLNVLGISCLPEENAVVAVCGQYLRNLSEAEIRSLFARNRVLLDGESALILLERGLGGLVHAVEATAVPSDSGVNAYEQVCDGFRYADLPEGRISCQGRAGDWVNIVYEKDPDVVLLSRVHAYTGAVSGPGLARIGNHAIILPYRFGGIIPASQFTRVRQHMLQRLMARWGVPVVQGGAPVGLYLYEDGMLLANASMDDAAGLSVCYARGAGKRVYEIRPHGGQTAVGAFSEDGIWRMEGTLPRMATRAFVFEEGMA